MPDDASPRRSTAEAAAGRIVEAFLDASMIPESERAGYDMFRDRPVLRWHDWPAILARAL